LQTPQNKDFWYHYNTYPPTLFKTQAQATTTMTIGHDRPKHIRQRAEYQQLCSRIVQFERKLDRLCKQNKGRARTLAESKDIRSIVGHIARMKSHHHPLE
jgi:hypothetical protein